MSPPARLLLGLVAEDTAVGEPTVDGWVARVKSKRWEEKWQLYSPIQLQGAVPLQCAQADTQLRNHFHRIRGGQRQGSSPGLCGGLQEGLHAGPVKSRPQGQGPGLHGVSTPHRCSQPTGAGDLFSCYPWKMGRGPCKLSRRFYRVSQVGQP